MTNDKTDILGQFGFELDAALFYDAIVKSTDVICALLHVIHKYEMLPPILPEKL